MKKILFVCMGNICRSPAAEGVFRSMAEKRGLVDRLKIDSAGTIGFHTGAKPDRRMTEAALERGYRLESRARQVKPSDLEDFDLILTMDDDNLRDVRSMDREGLHAKKIVPFCHFLTRYSETAVPDPYYGGAKGFEKVLDLLEDGCRNLLDEIAPDQAAE